MRGGRSGHLENLLSVYHFNLIIYVFIHDLTQNKTQLNRKEQRTMSCHILLGQSAVTSDLIKWPLFSRSIHNFFFHYVTIGINKQMFCSVDT